MARRNNRKITKAHHESMLAEDKERITKKRKRAERRAKKEQKARVEAILCDAFDKSFSVGDETKNTVPRIGAPVNKDIDTEMKSLSLSKRGKMIRKNKKVMRRLEKIRQRQANRAAMQM